MTAPPAGALEACLALLEKATPGEWITAAEHGSGLEWLKYSHRDVDAAAAAVNFLRAHGPALLAALRLREGCEGLVDSLPSNWCDPMLTGPTAVIGKPPYGCPEIEALIAAIKQRLRDDLARVLEQTK